MNKKIFLATIFFTLVFFNISRVIGWKFFSETGFWTAITNDNLHHWQLGLILIFVSLYIKKYVWWFYILLAISIGMVIDESMYIFSPLYWRFNHYSWEGIVFEFIAFGILSAIILKFGKKEI